MLTILAVLTITLLPILTVPALLTIATLLTILTPCIAISLHPPTLTKYQIVISNYSRTAFQDMLIASIEVDNAIARWRVVCGISFGIAVTSCDSCGL